MEAHVKRAQVGGPPVLRPRPARVPRQPLRRRVRPSRKACHERISHSRAAAPSRISKNLAQVAWRGPATGVDLSGRGTARGCIDGLHSRVRAYNSEGPQEEALRISCNGGLRCRYFFFLFFAAFFLAGAFFAAFLFFAGTDPPPPFGRGVLLGWSTNRRDYNQRDKRVQEIGKNSSLPSEAGPTPATGANRRSGRSSAAAAAPNGAR